MSEATDLNYFIFNIYYLHKLISDLIQTLLEFFPDICEFGPDSFIFESEKIDLGYFKTHLDVANLLFNFSCKFFI